MVRRRRMRGICAGCPTKVVCLEYALETDAEGAWGRPARGRGGECNERGPAFRRATWEHAPAQAVEPDRAPECHVCGTKLAEVETLDMGHWRGRCHRCNETREGHRVLSSGHSLVTRSGGAPDTEQHQAGRWPSESAGQAA